MGLHKECIMIPVKSLCRIQVLRVCQAVNHGEGFGARGGFTAVDCSAVALWLEFYFSKVRAPHTFGTWEPLRGLGEVFEVPTHYRAPTDSDGSFSSFCKPWRTHERFPCAGTRLRRPEAASGRLNWLA